MKGLMKIGIDAISRKRIVSRLSYASLFKNDAIMLSF